MVKGFKKDGDFIPTGDDTKKIKKDSVNSSTNSVPGSVKSGKKLHVEEPEDIEPVQVHQKFDEDGDPIVEETVTLLGYDIDIPEDEDKDSIIDDFLDANKAWKIIPVDKNDKKQDTTFEIALERGFQNAGLEVDSPEGSVYLSPDGKWYGGTGAFGYDEDHRPTMSKALLYSAMKFVSSDGHGDGETGHDGILSSTEDMIHALELSGFMRVGARGDLNLDLYHPITGSQRTALKNYAIEQDLGWNDVVADMNNGMKMPEDNVRRYIGVSDDNYNEDDY